MGEMAMTRKELSEMLGEKSLFSASKCAEFVGMVFETLTEALERGGKIKIAGFGNFIVKEKAARKGRNPKTGGKMEISAHRVVSFKPSDELRKTLNRGTT
jgi:integration host factor subunit alpha